MENKDNLPSCFDYAILLNKASRKFNISINQARSAYGLLTYNQWEKLIN